MEKLSHSNVHEMSEKKFFDNDGLETYKAGTVTDQVDMQRVGKKQELRVRRPNFQRSMTGMLTVPAQRNFRFLSLLGLTAVLMCSWEAILVTSSYTIPNGGLAGIVWIYLVTLTGFALVILSMAEMSSMAPTSGGQYHWVSEFSPRGMQKFLSFVTGWLCALAWQVNIASGCYIVALQVQSMILLNDATYTAPRWQATLLTIACAVIAILFNTFLSKRLPLVESLLLFIHAFGFVAILVTLWAMGPHQPSSVVFTRFQNAYGWPTQGLAFMVGITGPMYALLGPDAAVHMAEEVRDASKVIPWAMVGSLILNGATAFVMSITLAFCIPNIAGEVTPTYIFAYIDVFYNSTQSKAGATVMTCLLTLMFLCSTISCVATASRQIFAFARDRGLPFSSFLCRVRPGWDIPLNAVVVCFVITCLLSLINLGSSVAFNAIVSLAVGAILSSYIISISCIAWRKISHQYLPPTRWSLGRAGLPINIAAVAFMLVFYVFAFFPLGPAPTAETLNWSVVIYAGVVIFAVGYFVVYGRKVYKGPVVLVKRET